MVNHPQTTIECFARARMVLVPRSERSDHHACIRCSHRRMRSKASRTASAVSIGSSTFGTATTFLPRFLRVIGVAVISISSRPSPARISRIWPGFDVKRLAKRFWNDDASSRVYGSFDGKNNAKKWYLGNQNLSLVYGIAAYLLFHRTFIYAMGFVGNIGVPKSLDGTSTGPWLRSCLIDLGLLSLFALQHSGMARVAFKKQITRVISPTIERSTFVFASSIALLAVITLWRPLGGVVWSVQNEAIRTVLYVPFAFGWGLVLVTTFLIHHFELFGLQQVWRNMRGHSQDRTAFVTPLFYRVIRHPLYARFLLAFWCTPTMTVAHLLFAAMTTAYILVAIHLEERDLLRAHPEFAHYRERVPMLIPGTLGTRHGAPPGTRQSNVGQMTVFFHAENQRARR